MPRHRGGSALGAAAHGSGTLVWLLASGERRDARRTATCVGHGRSRAGRGGRARPRASPRPRCARRLAPSAAPPRPRRRSGREELPPCWRARRSRRGEGALRLSLPRRCLRRRPASARASASCRPPPPSAVAWRVRRRRCPPRLRDCRRSAGEVGAGGGAPPGMAAAARRGGGARLEQVRGAPWVGERERGGRRKSGEGERKKRKII